MGDPGALVPLIEGDGGCQLFSQANFAMYYDPESGITYLHYPVTDETVPVIKPPDGEPHTVTIV